MGFQGQENELDLHVNRAAVVLCSFNSVCGVGGSSRRVHVDVDVNSRRGIPGIYIPGI